MGGGLMSFNYAKTRIETEHGSVHGRLRSELVNLRMRVTRAIESLEADDGLDEFLIVNASGITADIARWNLVRDLLPLVTDPVVDTKPVARVPGKTDRRKAPYPDRQDRPRTPAVGNAEGMYKALSPRQRWVIATRGVTDKEVCDLFAARPAAETEDVVKRCGVWFAGATENVKRQFEKGTKR